MRSRAEKPAMTRVATAPVTPYAPLAGDSAAGATGLGLVLAAETVGLATGLAGDGAGLGEGTGAGLGLGGGGLDTGDGLGTGAGEGAALGLGETNHSVGAGAGVAEARDGTVTLVEAEYFLLLDMVAVSVQMYLPGVRPDTDAEPTLPLSSFAVLSAGPLIADTLPSGRQESA